MRRSLFTFSLKGTIFALSACALVSCSDKEDEKLKPAEEKTSGVYIVNEGSYTNPTGTVSFFDVNTQAVENNYFQKINQRPVGDVLQNLVFHNDKAYLVVNNSNKIEVTNASTFESAGVIDNLVYPRYFVAAGNKGYVSEWFNYGVSGRISVVDLASNTVIKTIMVENEPEKMLVYNNRVYVACSGSNVVTVINTETDAIEQNINVEDSPNSMVIDAQQYMWVLCGGKIVYNADYTDIDTLLTTRGNLIRFKPEAPAAQTVLPFHTNKKSPGRLCIDKSKTRLYYTLNTLNYTGALFEVSTSASTLPVEPLINRPFYGVNIDPNSNIIYTALNRGFTDAGWLVRYQKSGAVIDSFQVGTGPNGFVFR